MVRTWYVAHQNRSSHAPETAGSPTSGSEQRNVAPSWPGGFGISSSLPPCASATRRQNGRPSPVLRSPGSLARLTCSSKMRSACSGGTPTPVSDTVICKPGGSASSSARLILTWSRSAGEDDEHPLSRHADAAGLLRRARSQAITHPGPLSAARGICSHEEGWAPRARRGRI